MPLFGEGESNAIGTGILISLYDSFTENAEKINQSMEGIDNVSKQAADGIAQSMAKMKLGFGGLAMAAVIIAPFAEGIEQTAELSDAMVEVGSTTGIAGQELNKFKNTLQGIDTRSSVEGLAEISEIAGQFGAKGAENVAAFTERMDKLNVVLGSEFGGGKETIRTLGNLSNELFGFTTDSTEMASNIEHLGNAMAVLREEGAITGPVFTQFSNVIGGVGIPLGLTADQVLGLSATLQRLGVDSGRGATAVAMLFQKMTTDSNKFAMLAGMDIMSFKQLVNTDLMGAFLAVVKGSQRLSRSTDISSVLDKIGIDGRGVMDVFLRLGKNTDMLSESISTAGHALGNTDKLMEEFKNKNSTLGADLEKAHNAFDALGDSLGSGIQPLLQPLIEGFTWFVFLIHKLASTEIGKGIMIAVGAFALLLAAVSAVVVVTSLATFAAGKASAAFAELGLTEIATAFASEGLAAGLGEVAVAAIAAMIPLLPYVAVVAAVAGVVYLAVKSWQAFSDVLNGTEKPAEGFLGLMQKIGGIMQGSIAIWQGATSETFQWSAQMEEAFKGMGILDFMVALGTWISRIKEIFRGIADAVIPPVKAMWDSVVAVFEPAKRLVNSMLNSFGFSIEKLGGSMETFRTIGKAFGYIIDIAILPAVAALTIGVDFIIGLITTLTTVGLGLYSIYLTVSAGITAAVAAVIRFTAKAVNSVSDAFTGFMNWVSELPGIIGDFFSELPGIVSDAFTQLVSFAIQEFEKLIDWMEALPSSFSDWGSSLVHGIYDGIVNAWSWFTSAFTDLIKDIPGGKYLVDFFASGDTSGVTNGTGELTPAQAGVSDLGVATSQGKAQAADAGTSDSYYSTINNESVSGYQLFIDGKELKTRLNKLDKEDAGRQ